jgi:hypothetical protein
VTVRCLMHITAFSIQISEPDEMLRESMASRELVYGHAEYEQADSAEIISVNETTKN